MKIGIAATVLVLVAAPAAAQVSDILSQVDAEEPVQYIVGFYVLPENRDTYLGDKVVEVSETLRFFVVETAAPSLFEAKVTLDENVRYYELNEEVMAALFVPNDTFYNQYQYDMKPATTNMELAWDSGFGTTATKICVGDTGQNRDHEDLSGATYYFWKDVVNGDNTPYDDNGHGSHTTGTIAATPNNGQGVAGITEASIGGVKLMNRRGGATISQLATGLDECTNSGAHIHSHSWGTTSFYQAIEDAATRAVDAGQLVVAASGNEGPCSNCIRWPGRTDGVTTVGSTGPTNSLSSFSSSGPAMDFVAPGESIPSTWTGTNPCNKRTANTCYVLSSGTSMAAPHVAGLAGLVKSNNAGFTAQQIYDQIKATAADLGPSGFDNDYGWGLIQGDAA